MEKSVKDLLTEKLRRLKTQAEEMNLQMNLGKDEAKEAFESRKGTLVSWLDQLKDKMDEMGDVSEDKVIDLKTKMEELRLQAALGKAESEDAIKEQQANLSTGITDIKSKLKDVFATTELGAKATADRFEDELEGLQTKFELFKVQMGLDGDNAEEKMTQMKKMMSDKLDFLSKKMDEGGDSLEDKWDDITGSMSSWWKKVKGDK